MIRNYVWSFFFFIILAFVNNHNRERERKEKFKKPVSSFKMIHGIREEKRACIMLVVVCI